MKQSNFFISFLTMLLLTQVGCKKAWLDKKTNSSLSVPSGLKDFQALLDDADNIMNFFSSPLGEIASDGHYADQNYIQSADPIEVNAYTWSQLSPYTSSTEWFITYKRIFNCNLILEGLDKLDPNVDIVNWQNIKGQALFQRARSFYEITQLWSPPYVASTANSELGIPLRLESDINIPSTRSTLNETYTQILHDLLVAKDLLPATPLFKTRGSKASVFGLLARIYLSMEDYPKARQFADSALNITNTLLDFNSLDSTQPYPLKIFNSEVLFHNSFSVWGSISFSVLIDTSLYNLYSSDDLRKSVFFYADPGGAINFKGSYYGNLVPWGGIACDEMYLIRAECNARAGNTSLAMNDLNTLLIKRWKNSVPFPWFTATSADDALVQILIERKKELLLRGLRWSDLRRLNRDTRFQTTLTRTVGGQSYTLPPNSYKYTFPIPLDIIQKTGMQQNAGWQ